eukprot:276179_1
MSSNNAKRKLSDEDNDIDINEFINDNDNPNVMQLTEFHCQGGSASMTECDQLVLLKKMLKRYDSSQCNMHEEVVSILNGFHHLIHKHSSNEEFEEIYKCLGECNINECHQIRRHCRDRTKPKEWQKVTYIDDIIDKIHCHFFHSYDIGYRLNKYQRNKIEQKTADHDIDQK